MTIQWLPCPASMPELCGGRGDVRDHSTDFEAACRTALRALAATGRAMQINTSGWLLRQVLTLWLTPSLQPEVAFQPAGG